MDTLGFNGDFHLLINTTIVPLRLYYCIMRTRLNPYNTTSNVLYRSLLLPTRLLFT